MAQTVLLARIYSTKVEYSPSWDKEPEGRIKNTLELAFNKPEAWALALPFTGEHYVDSGTHMVPVFKGAPEWGPALRVLSEKGPSLEVSQNIFQSHIFSIYSQTLKYLVSKNQLTPLSSPKGHATLTLTILDGHFSEQVPSN